MLNSFPRVRKMSHVRQVICLTALIQCSQAVNVDPEEREDPFLIQEELNFGLSVS